MIDAIGDFDSPDPGGLEALAQITAHFLSGAIDTDEFNHYCDRQLKAVQQRAPRRAA
jgi:hypothetical protein